MKNTIVLLAKINTKHAHIFKTLLNIQNSKNTKDVLYKWSYFNKSIHIILIFNLNVYIKAQIIFSSKEKETLLFKPINFY
jgi:hypothetical protein